MAFNRKQFKSLLPLTRGTGFEKDLSTLCDRETEKQPNMFEFNQNNSSPDISELDERIRERIRCFGTSILDINHP